MNKKIIALVSICALATIVGCTKQNEAQNYNTKSVKESKINTSHMNMKSTETKKQRTSQKDELVKKIESIDGVKKATVYKDGQHVLIGMDLHDYKKEQNIKKEVQNYIAKEHPNHQIHITADQHLHSRIQKLKSLDGHPIRNTAEDINILIKDIGSAVTAPFEKK